ncbi:DNA repair protein RecO [Aquibacillus halophilus]|uniref:DNA repair protein RecO n=1 Tax=Aquibacillus halophilus TaxID=930132 RepID=A0A6A8DBL8_9BACI|nr:DNA repair protein RecO [Aquibacillus halophilus]MRH43093.1 DNA repair protein RecO [Aquibacillus halophilus]
MFEKVEGIILRTQDYGETHKIVTLLTKEKGKIGAIARGAKKPKSRMAAVAQPFIHGEFLVRMGSNLSTLQQGEIVFSYRPIREDIVKTAYASYIAELTDKLMDQKIPDPYLFQQLTHTLHAIAEDKDPEILTIIYELKMYKKAGFAPVVNHCVHCGGKNGRFSFSVTDGGILCQRCDRLDSNSFPLSDNLVKLLDMFSRVDVARIGDISVKIENKKLLQQIMEQYYDQYGGYFLKSKKFLKQLDSLS